MKIRGQRVIPAIERILSNIAKDENGCWNWTGSVRSAEKPYGRLTIGSRSDGTRRQIGAHQYSYMTFVGPIENGLAVCHHCDNPRCVNPEHLFLGTWKDNADDRDRKGRNSPPPVFRGEDAPWSKYPDALIEEIRSSPLSSIQASKKYGVNASYIRQIRRGARPSPPAPGGKP